jgi:hypothetical protein
MEKDKIAQSKIVRRIPTADTQVAEAKPAAPALKAEKVEKTEKAPAKKAIETPILDLDQEELDKKIEEALNEDLTK